MHMSIVLEMTTLVVSQCHSSNLPKMLTDAEAMLEKVYTGTRSSSNNLERTVGVETFLRTAIPAFLEQSYDPDKEVMLSRCQEMKEEMPEVAEKVARDSMAFDSK